MAILQAKARQNFAISPVDESDEVFIGTTLLGQTYVTSWQKKLMLAGHVWRVTTGSFGANADITQITGGGNGTTLELEQPEVAIGVDEGYRLIPIQVDVSVQADMDTTPDYIRIVALMDRTAGVPTSLTGTIESPENLLDGSADFPGRAFSAVTADITDPTMDELLAFKQNAHYEIGGDYTIVAKLNLHYKPRVPSIAKGPCGLYVYWGGSTAAAIGLATVVVAAVPEDWFKN